MHGFGPITIEGALLEDGWLREDAGLRWNEFYDDRFESLDGAARKRYLEIVDRMGGLKTLDPFMRGGGNAPAVREQAAKRVQYTLEVLTTKAEVFKVMAKELEGALKRVDAPAREELEVILLSFKNVALKMAEHGDRKHDAKADLQTLNKEFAEANSVLKEGVQRGVELASAMATADVFRGVDAVQECCLLASTVSTGPNQILTRSVFVLGIAASLAFLFYLGRKYFFEDDDDGSETGALVLAPVQPDSPNWPSARRGPAWPCVLAVDPAAPPKPVSFLLHCYGPDPLTLRIGEAPALAGTVRLTYEATDGARTVEAVEGVFQVPEMALSPATVTADAPSALAVASAGVYSGSCLLTLRWVEPQPSPRPEDGAVMVTLAGASAPLLVAAALLQEAWSPVAQLFALRPAVVAAAAAGVALRLQVASPGRWPVEAEGALLKLSNGVETLEIPGRVTLCLWPAPGGLLSGCAVAEFPLGRDVLAPFLGLLSLTLCEVCWSCGSGVSTLFSSSPAYDVGWKILAHSAEATTSQTMLLAPQTSQAPFGFSLRLRAFA